MITLDKNIFITIIVIVIVVVLVLIAYICSNYSEKIQSLKKTVNEYEKEKQLHIRELNSLKSRLNNLDEPALHLISGEFYDILSYYAISNNRLKDIKLDYNKRISKEYFINAITSKYKLEYIYYLYPELQKLFLDNPNANKISPMVEDIQGRTQSLFEIIDALNDNKRLSELSIYQRNRINFLEAAQSNLTAIPYMAALVADYETYGLEKLAHKLDWGYSQLRLNKVKSIREIRKDAQAMVEKNKESQYQLAYLLNLFPSLEDIIETDFNHLPALEVSSLPEHDNTLDWLSKEEFISLSTTERNQLALDRYKQSKSKSKWQIGRDYEHYVGYKYSQIGFNVDYFGSYKGLEDLGRDLIAKKNNKTVIIQCKYWSQKKLIHEKHIMQLYGTTISYCIENSLPFENVNKVLITNIQLSSTAKKYANYLGVQYKENIPLGDYPCIKCNIGHDEFGNIEKIYHLPFDQQYDVTKIDKPGEFFAMTVKEAEDKGFRRAFKWFSE